MTVERRSSKINRLAVILKANHNSVRESAALFSTSQLEHPSDRTGNERRLAVERIIKSSIFRKSPRLSQLLSYLTEQTILDRAEFVTEHAIAREVFDRGADFDPSIDTIVRSHMVRLRHKLGQYFSENEATEPIRLVVPKGDYVLRFEEIKPPPAKTAQTEFPRPSIDPAGERRRLMVPLAGLGILLAVLLGGALFAGQKHSPVRAAAATQKIHPLWSLIFRPQPSAIFVAADSGLVLLHGMTHRETTLAEYLSRDFREETRTLSPQRTAEVLDMSSRRYTSFADLETAHRLEELAIASQGTLKLKYARDIHIGDFKDGNIILSGARGANPWLELFEPEMNFVRVHDPVNDRFSFINRHPKAGESASYAVSHPGRTQEVLGVLALLPNLSGTGNVLILEGSSLAGTEAIEDFLFDDRALLPFLSSIKAPDGSLPHFEVLLGSSSVNGSAGPFHILAYCTHS
jgi:hypothetical protein